MEPAAKRAKGATNRMRYPSGSSGPSEFGDFSDAESDPNSAWDRWGRLRNPMGDLATQGYTAGGPAAAGGGMGSAWDGQMQSLQSDAFLKKQAQDVRDDIHTTITTSSHVMNQGGQICQTWMPIESIFKLGARNSLLNVPMAYLTGNQMHGMSNLFNQYYLCKLKAMTITFKDIVVATEASTNVGLHFMSDVITEWRRRPTTSLVAATAPSAGYNVITDFASADGPDWWQDWRPATDGAVEFTFPVNSTRWLPISIVDPGVGINSVNARDWQDPQQSRRFVNYLYNISVDDVGGYLWEKADAADNGQPIIFHGIGIGTSDYNPYVSAGSTEWLDFVFEWRARNCPNTESSVNTSAEFNIQINCVWDMAYRQTKLNRSFIQLGT